MTSMSTLHCQKIEGVGEAHVLHDFFHLMIDAHPSKRAAIGGERERDAVGNQQPVRTRALQGKACAVCRVRAAPKARPWGDGLLFS